MVSAQLTGTNRSTQFQAAAPVRGCRLFYYMATTIDDLEDRARSAIQREESWVVALARRHGKPMSRIQDATWFRAAVMHELATTTQAWQHLEDEVANL